MTLIKPFAAWLPTKEYIKEAISPPYDVVDREEARAFAKDKRYNFLHITRSEIDCAKECDPYAPEIYTAANKCLQTFIANEVIVKDKKPSLYLYRLTQGGHSQTGIVCLASVQAYCDGQIRKHELTRPAKEQDRLQHIDTCNGQLSPVLLTYKHRADLGEFINECCQTRAIIEVTAADGVYHQLWRVNDSTALKSMTAAINELELIYIADGHHRCAAAAGVAKNRGTLSTPDKSENWFLSVLFPDSDLKIFGYHRVIRKLPYASEQFFEDLDENFDLVKLKGPSVPTEAHQFHLYFAHNWWQATFKNTTDKTLAVDILAKTILSPLLSIQDQRSDPNIDFIGGSNAAHEIMRKVDNGEFVLGIMVKPTSTAELLNVADKNQIMPPKSTWFEPKLADGLLSYLY